MSDGPKASIRGTGGGAVSGPKANMGEIAEAIEDLDHAVDIAHKNAMAALSWAERLQDEVNEAATVTARVVTARVETLRQQVYEAGRQIDSLRQQVMSRTRENNWAKDQVDALNDSEYGPTAGPERKPATEGVCGARATVGVDMRCTLPDGHAGWHASDFHKSTSEDTGYEGTRVTTRTVEDTHVEWQPGDEIRELTNRMFRARREGVTGQGRGGE